MVYVINLTYCMLLLFCFLFFVVGGMEMSVFAHDAWLTKFLLYHVEEMQIIVADFAWI